MERPGEKFNMHYGRPGQFASGILQLSAKGQNLKVMPSIRERVGPEYSRFGCDITSPERDGTVRKHTP